MSKLSRLPHAIGRMPNRIGTPPKIADSFYLSPEWRGLMASIKRERGSQCEKCGAKGRVLGDHIREIKDGGAKLDASNVMLMCIGCHNGKTAKARARRARG